MNRKRLVLLIGAVLALAAGGLFVVIRVLDFPASQAVLSVRSGSAAVTHADGVRQPVVAGSDIPVRTGDSIQVDGQAALILAGAQTDLGTGTQLEVTHYGASGDEAQTDLLLKAGQAWQRVYGYSDDRSQYRLRYAGLTVSTRGGEVLVYTDDQGAQVGLLSGSATVSGQGRTITLGEGQGTIIPPGLAPPDPTPWSSVHVMTYRPDGSAVTLPFALANSKTGDQYRALSNQSIVVPEGTYRLTVDTVEPYQVDNLSLPASTLSEVPVTLSEVLFTTTDARGVQAPYTGLRVQGANDARAVPDSPLLISPGTWTLIVAREENPIAIQPVKVELSPGQRLGVALRNDLFGGGVVEVHVIGPDGKPWQPTSVFVYAAGSESGQPLLTFLSDTTPQALPEGSYVISVRTPIGQRFEVTIKQNENSAVRVQLGSIKVNFTDAQGLTATRLVYIASAIEMKRLGLSVDRLRQTPYGVAINSGTTIIVPSGVYNVRVGDQNEAAQEGVQVDAGQAVTLDLKAGQPSG
jgi:ferric-dicitrate binding protein FerR (iron transport regulator)